MGFRASLIRIFGFVFLASTLGGLTGCSSTTAQWRRAYCNYDGAYAAGINDFRADRPLDVTSYAECSGDERTTALRGYREGYMAAMSTMHRPRRAVIVAPAVPAYGGQGR